MKKLHNYIFAFFHFLLTPPIYFLDLIASEDQSHRFSYPSVLPTPARRTAVTCGGNQQAFEEEVRAYPVISLGGNCIGAINTILHQTDDFIIFFMYRFNSPILINTLENKFLSSQINGPLLPIIVFLDYHQTYPQEATSYSLYVNKLINSVPSSIVKLGSKSFHQKVILTKKRGEQAITIMGSANATFEADNVHSEDLIFIQSNKLAHFYLETFAALLRMEPSQSWGTEQKVQVFHEYPLIQNRSNIDIVKNLIANVQAETDTLTIESYKSRLLTVGLSTGFSVEEGTQKCITIIEEILKNRQTKFLILFENFISFKEEGPLERCIRLLKSKIPKLIVLDHNDHNQEAVNKLKCDENTIFLFRPYTGGKFHHKLIIQYPQLAEPIVYTGSFHLSTNAIANNSETVVGLQSSELADDYLASLLENSGLAQCPNVWKFIYDNMFKDEEEGTIGYERLLQTARSTQKKILNSMNLYTVRLEAVQESMEQILKNTDDRNTFFNHFNAYMGDFRNRDALEKLDKINMLRENLFEVEEFHKSWFNSVEKIVRSLNKKLAVNNIPLIDDLEGQETETVLVLLKSLLEEVESSESKKKEDALKELTELYNLYNSIKRLEIYTYEFEKLSDLLRPLLKISGDPE